MAQKKIGIYIPIKGEDFFDMIFVIDVKNLLHLESIINILRKVENVSTVSRLFIN